jgi:hypothetical protein
MQSPFFGGCPCGAARFRCDAKPAAMYNCHCRGCQKLYGAPYVPLLVLPLSATTLSGEIRSLPHAVPDDKHWQRVGCARCGFPLLARSEAMPEVCVMNAMSLDDPSWFHPVADIWAAHAQAWVRLDRRIPKVHKSPPVLGGEIA